MNETVAKLIVVLDDLISCHQALLEVEQEKQQLIISQDWNLLEERIDRSRSLLGRIQAGETVRIDLIEEMGFRRESVLSEIVNSIPHEQSSELEARSAQLKELVFALKELNRLSEQLLESSLEGVDFTLSLIAGSGVQGKTYSGNGEESSLEGKKTSFVFDAKA
jgi:flagellar biosynthesis/type III secretory pathway chaperone